MTIAGGSDITAICARCGYDLRNIESDRCPECGFDLARQTALSGEIPWTYRRARGRIRSFVETVWRVTIGGAWLSRVTASPVSMRDARRFWLVAATVAAFPLMAAVAYTQLRHMDAWMYVYTPDAMLMGPRPDYQYLGQPVPWYAAVMSPGVHSNVLWPIAAALEIPGLAILVVWLFVLLASGIPVYRFHPRNLGPQHRQRSAAFGYYTCAPLALCSLPLLILAASYITIREQQPDPFGPLIVIAVLMAIVVALLLLVWIVRLLKTLVLLTQARVARFTYNCVFLIAGWLGCAIFALLFVPWCIGTARLFLDALF